MEIVPDDGDDVTIEATPLSSKSPKITNYNIHKEENKKYFKISRVDGNSQVYLTFNKMLKNFNREDLETLWRIVKERFANAVSAKSYCCQFKLMPLEEITTAERVNAADAKKELKIKIAAVKLRSKIHLEFGINSAAVEAIGNYHLCLPSGLVIVLNNCQYALSITRGIILVSRLYDDGFINRFDLNNVISVSKNNIVYFSAIPRDGIYEIDLSLSNTNDSSMYALSNKRAKLNLDSSLLWHCRLGHIIKKHIEKLQHDGLLNSIDIESLGKCVSCMSRKMARKPYSHQVERAKDLLGLIHTNVCGPFRIVSRQGASYFVTFTDDFSRYGYVYLLKHKHEVFETFKVFQKEVENQLGKTIKSLRSDCRGYPKETMGYSFYYPPKNKVFVARNVEFFESNLIDHEASGSLEDLKIIQEEDTNPSLETSLNYEEDDQEINEPQSDIIPICKSSRTRRASDRMCLYIDVEEHELGGLGESANYKATLLDPESEKWLVVMNVEMQSMKDSDVWELVELPPNAKTIGYKWLFKKKTDMDGAVHTFKSCLIAKGFIQTYGVDYKETFSPVADIRAIRILIAIAAYYDYEIWQIDVKTAFLNRHLSKEVYMMQLKGFVNPKYPNHVCKLKHSIYGLKQASRQWNKRFDDEIKKFGFTQNQDEPCVYLKASGSYVTFLILYVDDILIMGNNIPMLQDVKSYLGRCFAMKDLGEAAYILGIKIYLDRSKRLIDAEYIAAFDASKEAVWICKFTSGHNVVPTIEEPITMYCDVKIEKIDTDDNLDDPFTKALAFPKHSELTRKIGLIPASSLMQVQVLLDVSIASVNADGYTNSQVGAVGKW
ncbi:retrotransposon protein, putative, ty1-copia subclass [Tanacetum coccineum]